jgi:uncharacterized glyoxalase superfamily protein PhnB
MSRNSVQAVYPYLCVRGAAQAIDFYLRVFGATESFRLTAPDGRIGHAELMFGTATIMLADEHPENGVRSPLAYGGTGVTIHLHVDNVDTMARAALDAGATMVRPPEDFSHGERQCRIRDPFGHEWLLGHPIAEVSVEEMQRRYSGDQADGSV